MLVHLKELVIKAQHGIAFIVSVFQQLSRGLKMFQQFLTGTKNVSTVPKVWVLR